VVQVTVRDPQGRNPKCRPAVVISRDDEIAAGGDVWVVGVTGQSGREPSLEVELQYDPQGKCRTGLRKPSVALCGWLTKVAASDVVRCVGHIPPVAMALIALKVEEVRKALLEPPSGT
jgi:mRNA-degrading endonuclease toxin of MazEF toxin-antitoxin module